MTISWYYTTFGDTGYVTKLIAIQIMFYCHVLILLHVFYEFYSLVDKMLPKTSRQSGFRLTFFERKTSGWDLGARFPLNIKSISPLLFPFPQLCIEPSVVFPALTKNIPDHYANKIIYFSLGEGKYCCI